MPYPLPLTRTEAYLAYKAGVIQQSDLKPSLTVPRNGIDAWLAYWTGLAADYPKREDGTPHILQEEEAYIAYLSGVINEYPEKCLRRVGAYLRYLISARWGRPDHPLNREELYLSLIKTQFIPSGDPSSDITIDGTAKAAFVDVKMYGDTFQQSYSGKNLVNLTDLTAIGVTGHNNGDGTVTISGTATGSSSVAIMNASREIEAGTYTLTISKALPFTINLSYRGVSFRIAAGSTSVTTTATSSFSSGNLWVVLIGNTTYNETFGIQLTQGSTADYDFEPYVGGQPSPSPDFPQPIQTVTGEQTVSINGTDYPINLGSIELCKLSTYQDYIWKDGEDWKVHKEIGYEKKIVSLAGINGYSSVYGTATTSNGAFAISSTNWGSDYATTAGVAIASSVIGVYQSQNIDGNNSANSMVDGSFCQRSGTNDRVYFRFASWARSKTVDEVNQMVTDNGGIDLWYPLATPTDTTITDQTLIAQLDALLNGGAEDGTTYIKVKATDPNLPGLLYVEAPKYDQKGVRHGLWWKKKSKKKQGIIKIRTCQVQVSL